MRTVHPREMLLRWLLMSGCPWSFIDACSFDVPWWRVLWLKLLYARFRLRRLRA